MVQHEISVFAHYVMSIAVYTGTTREVTRTYIQHKGFIKLLKIFNTINYASKNISTQSHF